MRTQFRLIAAGAGFEDDAGEDVLAVIRIGNTDCRGLEHRGMAQQRLVDLARRDVLAALDDQLLAPAGDEIEPVAVPVAEVARGKPAVGGAEPRGPGGPVKTRHDTFPAHLDLALSPDAEHGTVGGDDSRLHA